MWLSSFFLFFFFNDTATTEIYTLSLHDALPISGKRGAFLGAGTTVQRCAAVGESCSSPRGSEIGFPFTSSVASLDVSLRIRYHAPRRSGVCTFSLRRAHWNACCPLPRGSERVGGNFAQL